MNGVSNFYSGTSNVVLPVPNKQAFPPAFQQASRLHYYASLFNSVEINSTFYKLPQGKTIARWADDVPENFRFTFKLWKEISHLKNLAFSSEQVQQFINVINQAGTRLGCLLIQFPPSTSYQPQQLENLLVAIQQSELLPACHIAVEFRNKSWYNTETYDLLEQYKAGMVMHDIPASATPMLQPWAQFAYLRFHGPEGGYRGSYTDAYLHEYAGYATEWLQDDLTVYAYFNNTLGDALNNLITFNDFVSV